MSLGNNAMATSFKDVFDEINQLIKKGSIEINGKTVQLEFFLGGDYKVIKNCKSSQVCVGKMSPSEDNYTCMSRYCIILFFIFQFLLAMLGLNAANSCHACIYCKIDKDKR